MLDLEALKKMEAAATPGEWLCAVDAGDEQRYLNHVWSNVQPNPHIAVINIQQPNAEENAEFLCVLRNSALALIAELEALRTENAALKAEADRLESIWFEAETITKDGELRPALRSVAELNARQCAELEALRQDKARLDWLGGPLSVSRLEELYVETHNADEFRAAIDAAMQAKSETPNAN